MSTAAVKTRQSLLGAGLLSFGGAMWGLVLALITIPILVRGLGLSAYGLYSLAFSFAGFGAYLDFGLTWTISKFVAEADAQNNQPLLTAVVRAALLYNIALGVIFVTILSFLAGWIAQSLLRFSPADAPIMAQVLRLAALAFLLSSTGGVLVSTLRGLGRFAVATSIQSTAMTVSLVGAAIAAHLGKGVIAATSLQLGGASLGLALALWACREPWRSSVSSVSTARQLRIMLGFSAWNYMTRLIQMFAMQADKVLVARVAGPAFLPLYAVPYNVGQKINFVGGPAVTAMYPTAAAGQFEPDLFMKKYFSGSRLVHMVTGAAAIAMLFWGRPFLNAWIGAEMADQGTFFLKVFTIGFWLVSVGSVDGGCIEGWNHPKLTFAISGISFGMAIILALTANPFVGAVRAIAMGVGGYLSFAGIGQIILWQRISRYSAARFFRQIALPLAEMVGLALIASLVLSHIVMARFLVMGALPAIAGLLVLWGIFRSFASDERRMLLARLLSFSGVKL